MIATGASRGAGQSVADQLRMVESADEMHRLFVELAGSPNSRWTRTQILYYLPIEFHGIAAEYFDGERLVIPQRTPIQLSTANALDLDHALESLESLPTARQVVEEPADHQQLPGVEELTADPPADDNDVIGNVLAALAEEARAVDRESPKRYGLSVGRCTGPRGAQFVYTFRWSSEPDLYVPGELSVRDLRIPARVGRQAHGERRFELLVDTFLGPTVDRAIFRIDPTFLLRTAFQKLKALRDTYNSGGGLAPQLFFAPESNARAHSNLSALGLNVRQSLAVSVAAQNKRSYVWGPPGTGKTTSLGQLIRILVGSGQRVLVLSPYNIAVDQAILAAKGNGDWSSEAIVRIGRISDDVHAAAIDLDSLLERRAESSGLLFVARQFHASVFRAYGCEDRPAPATVRKCLEELGEVVVRGAGTPEETSKRILAGIRRIRDAFRVPEDEILRNASVVATTVALSYLLPIHERPFDHIVVDESSVLRVPEALLVALSASNRLSFFGDPKQLPSIVKVRSPTTERWLKPNPFDLAGIARPSDAKGSCVFLAEQHRMAPPIRELISRFFYDDCLEDGRCPEKGRLILLDSSETPARATTRWVRMGPSKENLVHRTIVGAFLSQLEKCYPTSSALVLSPYVAQKRGYEGEANTNRARNARFATVHTSQGTESDVVIVDLVLAPGRGKSRFMDERRTPEFRNLLNVAMSRAKHQLVLIAHVEYVFARYPDGLLSAILRHVAERGESYRVPESLRMNRFMQGILPDSAYE
jgi:hypothetical protein